MRSVLGPIFSYFYMYDIKNKMFGSVRKPSIYLRYIDDILILANDIDKSHILQDTLQKHSVFNFTHELYKNNKMSSLVF